MAKIGLNSFRYGILTEGSDGTPHYAGALTPGKAISCSVSITSNDVKLYADDAVAETDTGFQSGTVTIGIDDDDVETLAGMLGHTVTNGAVIRSANDVAPYIGFGRVVSMQKDNTRKYKAEILYKVKLSEPSQEDQTQGEALEFSTITVEGQIATLLNGKWSEAKLFDTKTAAVAYIENLFSATPSV